MLLARHALVVTLIGISLTAPCAYAKGPSGRLGGRSASYAGKSSASRSSSQKFSAQRGPSSASFANKPVTNKPVTNKPIARKPIATKSFPKVPTSNPTVGNRPAGQFGGPTVTGRVPSPAFTRPKPPITSAIPKTQVGSVVTKSPVNPVITKSPITRSPVTATPISKGPITIPNTKVRPGMGQPIQPVGPKGPVVGRPITTRPVLTNPGLVTRPGIGKPITGAVPGKRPVPGDVSGSKPAETRPAAEATIGKGTIGKNPVDQRLVRPPVADLTQKPEAGKGGSPGDPGQQRPVENGAGDEIVDGNGKVVDWQHNALMFTVPDLVLVDRLPATLHVINSQGQLLTSIEADLLPASN